MKHMNLFRHCTWCNFLKKMVSVVTFLSLLFIVHTTDLRAQMASCHTKFVGNIWYNGTKPLHFDQYFNQLTPENATKWALVQGSGPSSWNWGDATSMYNYCKSNGIPFKFHTLVWGNQYPTWLDNASDKAAAVENWIKVAGNTFPNSDFVDVVNECLPNHAQPSWLWSIGGTDGLYGTGWDWVVWSFEKARQYFPNSKLLINDYNILNNSWNNDLDVLCQIVNILKGRGLIDGIGLQSHGLASTPGADVTYRLNRITSQCPGVPIYISEFDLDIADDNQQKNKMAELFPIFWNNPSVKGITFWGYVQGHTWIPNSHLIRYDGSERPAMVWLKDYLSCEGCNPTSITPYIQVNDSSWQQTASVTVDSGAKVVFGPQPSTGGSWSWSGCGTSGTSREQTVYPTGSCTSIATYTNSCGATSTQNFTVNVNGSSNGQNVHLTKSNATGFAIDGNNGGENGQQIYLWANDINNVNQTWVEIDRGGGYYSYQKLNTNYCMDGGNGGENGQSVYLWTCDAENQNQHWQKISAGSNFRLQKRNAPGYSIDGGNGGENGQILYLWASDANNQNQQWIFSTSSLKSASETEGLNENLTGSIAYPNPVTSVLDLQLTAPAKEIVVYSVEGKQLYSQNTVSENVEIDMSGFRPGIYIVKAIGQNETWTQKILKK
jgi:GH35 family endo-1,4-beta-xylanase